MARILIVDDDEDFGSAVMTAVQSAGHTVEHCLTTRSALDSLRKGTPDLMILDVMFPENESAGFEFARDIQNVTGSARIPILMLTAINKKSPVGFSARDIDDTWLPVDDFIEKPVDFALLMTKVTRLLEKHNKLESDESEEES